MSRSFLGRLSVFSRWNKARYKRGKRDGNLNKQHFLMIWSSLVHPWFDFGSSLVFSPRQIGIALGARFLTKSTFAITHSFGGRAYPVRHYPVAIRLRTRKGCAILCIALNPQSGDFSGAILGVRSVALLHLGSSLVLLWSLTRGRFG